MDSHYDIAIIGLGCAGAHILLELCNRPQAHNLTIAVIDNNKEDYHHKTWCYWETGAGKWDKLISHSWSKGSFISSKRRTDFNITPYAYKMLESSTFYAFAKAELSKYPNITLIKDYVTHVASSTPVSIKCENNIITADLVLDSRWDRENLLKSKKATTILQPFKGWVIEASRPVFTPERFTMMDYRVKAPGTTSFTYVLPFSTTTALVEFTYFVPEMPDDTAYDDYLKQYCEEILGLTEYKITAVESGTIPMTTYNFKQHNTHNVIKIGTAGGWVKPSTGYSFKFAEKKAAQLVDNYFSKTTPLDPPPSKKYQLYDKTMLDVLKENNEAGEKIFETIYRNKDIKRVFRFLDEESSLPEDISMMKPLTSMPFISNFIKNLISH